MTLPVQSEPELLVPVRTVFGIDSDLEVPAFRERDDHVPDVDDAYRFNPEVTLAILAGFARNWRRARTDLTALHEPTLYREGIDGEALDWACDRLMQRAARRRILMVISDGCPMDSATALANDRFYLDKHLKEVVARHEQAGLVEVVGLGVGLDLSPYFRRCLATDPAEPIGHERFLSIAGLIAGRRRR